VVAVNPNHAEAHNNLGLAYKNMGEFSRAEQEFKQAIQLRSNVAEFHFNLGLVYKETNRYNEAEQAFNQALKLKPSLAVVHYNLGLMAETQGNYDLASQRYQQAIKTNPRFALAYTKLGLLFLNKMGDSGQALRLLKQSMSLNPNQPNAAGLKKLIGELEQKLAAVR
jgi:superkiller protein 3